MRASTHLGNALREADLGVGIGEHRQLAQHTAPAATPLLLQQRTSFAHHRLPTRQGARHKGWGRNSVHPRTQHATMEIHNKMHWLVCYDCVRVWTQVVGAENFTQTRTSAAMQSL